MTTNSLKRYFWFYPLLFGVVLVALVLFAVRARTSLIKTRTPADDRDTFVEPPPPRRALPSILNTSSDHPDTIVSADPEADEARKAGSLKWAKHWLHNRRQNAGRFTRDELWRFVERNRQLQLSADKIAADKIHLTKDQYQSVVELVERSYQLQRNVYADVQGVRSLERVKADEMKIVDIRGRQDRELRAALGDKFEEFWSAEYSATKELRRVRRAFENMTSSKPSDE